MFQLTKINDKLSLVREHATEKPIYVDFSATNLQYRIGNNRLDHEQLKKVFNLSAAIEQPTVLDLTAGFGQDSLLLAGIGYKVTMLERNEIMHQLLADGLARAREHSATNSIVQNMHLIHADAIDYLQALPATNFPEAIYFDPMFEPRKKTALVNKNMQVLHQLVGPDQDASEVLRLALTKAKKKIIVKRHRLAPKLLENCNYIVAGKTVRFDVYLPIK